MTVTDIIRMAVHNRAAGKYTIELSNDEWEEIYGTLVNSEGVLSFYSMLLESDGLRFWFYVFGQRFQQQAPA